MQAAYSATPALEAFVAEAAATHQLDADSIRTALLQARKQPSVQKAIMPGAVGTKKNWRVYRSRFIDQVRIQAGVKFWNANEEALRRAADVYGVPEAIIVGIIGVETIYGRNMGSYRVIDALATLTFDFPTGRSDRSPYFREQLAYFFAWCAKEGYDPLSIKGSYAGAIGIPQFMPESILKFATDFDADNHINLTESASDAIGSVAKYLERNGWVRDLAPALRIQLDRANLQILLEPDITPTFTGKQLLEYGVELQEPLPAGEKFAVVELQNGEGRSDYVLGTQNFYSITRYNRSSYYAMSVIDLASEVAAARLRK
jgi:membrane-bound lytic murein transglycosylase B